MDLPLPFLETAIPWAVLATARVVGFVAIGTLPLGPGVPLVVRVALAWAMSLAAVAWVVPASLNAPPATPLLLAIPCEVALGSMLALSVACVTAAAAWAGSVLGSISGLSWADDYSQGPTEAATPLARLVWWAAAGAFVACGGARVVLAGLLDSYTTLPLGGWLEASLSGMLLTALAMACRLMVALAVPALIAVLAWHISAAIACRVIPLAPSAGLLQGSAAIVLLAAIWAGGQTWTDGIADAMVVTCERVFEHAEPRSP